MNAYDLMISSLETLGMTLISTALAYLIGVPLGILLNITGKTGIWKNRPANLILGIFVNLLRSIPGMLIVVLAIPINQSIIGYAYNHWYSMIIPLFLSSFAYVARVVEGSLNEVPGEEIEGIKSLGANNRQIVTKVLIPESKSSLIAGVAVTAVNIIGYTAFAYDLNNGGLISYIYGVAKRTQWTNIYTWDVWAGIFAIVIIVQIIQELGLHISKKVDKRRKAK